jgi:hypothetical protein
MTSCAWLEPSTASVIFYFSCSLLNGHGGVRLLKRRLRKAREWGKDVLSDEFSEFLCDHPELLLITLLTTSTLRLVYHPQPSFASSLFLGFAGLPDYHNALHLSCRHCLPAVPRHVRFTGRQLQRRFVRPVAGMHFRSCQRDGGGASGSVSPLSHVRLLPFLRDKVECQRHEEAMQDT